MSLLTQVTHERKRRTPSCWRYREEQKVPPNVVTCGTHNNKYTHGDLFLNTFMAAHLLHFFKPDVGHPPDLGVALKLHVIRPSQQRPASRFLYYLVSYSPEPTVLADEIFKECLKSDEVRVRRLGKLRHIARAGSSHSPQSGRFTGGPRRNIRKLQTGSPDSYRLFHRHLPQTPLVGLFRL